MCTHVPGSGPLNFVLHRYSLSGNVPQELSFVSVSTEQKLLVCSCSFSAALYYILAKQHKDQNRNTAERSQKKKKKEVFLKLMCTLM